MVKLPFAVPQLGRRTRKVLFGVGMFFLALLTFVFAFQAVFPYGRVSDRLEDLAAAKIDLKVGKVKRSWVPGRFFLENVTLKTYPTKDEIDQAMAIADPKERDKALAQASTTFFIDEVMVDVGMLSFLKGTASVDFVAKLDDGRISGNLSVSKGRTVVAINGSDVPSERLPMREVLSNLPMAGDVDFSVELDLPNNKLKNGKVGPDWPNAEGEIEFECPSGCTIGDGKAKLKLKAKNARSQAFAGEGTEFGKVQITSLLAQAELKDGKFDITKFDSKSPDIELHVDYTMTLAENIDQSAVLGCIRFKGTDALRKREPKTYDQILLTGAARNMSDGLDNIKLEGTFKALRKLAKLCGPNAGNGRDIDTPTHNRPNLTIHTDDAPPPTPTTHAPTPPINPPPPTATLDAGVPSAPADAHPATGIAPPVEHAGSGSGSDTGSGGEPQPVPENEATGGAAPPG